MLCFSRLSALFLGVSRRTQVLSELARGLDRLYGAPSSTQYAALKEGVAAILGDKAYWPLYFRVVLGAQQVNQTAVEQMLKDAVRASRAAGYHSASTNFAAVHSSGTSKLLRKGESYTTGKDVNGVVLTLGWNFPEVSWTVLTSHLSSHANDSQDELKLDASCLFFSRGAMCGAVDWKNRTHKLTGAAVQHSGTPSSLPSTQASFLFYSA
jgi:hypothetical protein